MNLASQIYEKAMRFLAMREHSRYELQQKLTLRFPKEKTLIAQIIAKLAEDNLQSDERFAKSYVRSRTEKLYGPIKIRYELKQKGITDDLITIALEENNIDWFFLAEKARQKKFGKNTPQEWLDRVKQQNYLHQRGFKTQIDN